jgi:hypothetical protein
MPSSAWQPAPTTARDTSAIVVRSLKVRLISALPRDEYPTASAALP